MTQIYAIAWFYVITVITDFMLFELGKEAIETHHLLCVQNEFLIVHDELGSLFIFFQSIMVLFYSFFMFYVFYMIPLKFKLVSFSKFGQRKINPLSSQIVVNQSMLNQDSIFKEFAKIEDENKEFESKKISIKNIGIRE